MKKQQNIAQVLEDKIEHHIENSPSKYGLLLLIFISVLREGVETVLFLSAIEGGKDSSSIIGAILGIVIATFLGIGIFKGGVKVNLKSFFNITSILLLFFAAGLLAYGIHELQDAEVIPSLIYPVWDLKTSIHVVFDDKGTLGSILKGLFGYNHNPSLLEILGYFTYFAIVGRIWLKDTFNKSGS